MDTVVNTLIAGSAYTIAGGCGLVRHFLLEPKFKTPRQVPKWLLHVFFIFSAVLLYVGLRFLWAFVSDTAHTAPPGATGMGVVMGLALLLYKGSLLKDATDQYRLAGELWRH